MLNKYPSQSFPLSHPQQRIWFAEIINPNTGVGNLVGHSELQEPINNKILGQAINELIKSADTLRLRIQTTQDGVVQYVADYEVIALKELEFSTEAQFKQHIDTLIRYPFAADNTALYYFELIRVTGQPTRLVYCFHHVIMDAASMKITVDAIYDNYRQLTRGRECLPLDDQDYRHYLKYEADYLSSEKCAHDKNFWAEKLSTYEETAQIKRVNKSVSVHADRINYHFDHALNQKVQDFCKREKTSAYRLLIAAYYVYLSRLSGRRDTVIGTVFHNRFNLEFCDKIGMFVSTTPVRLAVDESTSFNFRELLSLVANEVELAQHHQDYPFDLLIQERKQIGLDAPLFEAAISYQNSSFILPTEFHFQKAQEFPLVIHLSHRGDNNQLKLELDYQTDYFSRAEASAICTHLLTVIEAAIANPQSDIENLAILTQDEQQKLVNPGSSNHFIPKYTITELFEQQVAINPDALAVVDDGTSVTYRDLNAQANQLAISLQTLNVTRETLVAVLLPRSSEMIIAMLGIIKAGGAYLPIDPDYPQDRIEFMLQDSNSTLLVTTSELANDYSSPGNLLLIDKLLTVTGEHRPVSGKPDDLFYVIYTSGSTGRPKGVAVEHASFENLIYTHRRIYSEGTGTRMSQVASVSFDAMAFEVWPCLTSGATLYIANDETRLDPTALKEWLVRNKITVSFQSTLMAERLLEEKWPAETALRFLRTAGDKLNRFPSHPLPFAVHNLYGPTEDTVWTTLADVSWSENNNDVPDIGYALDNKHIVILSQRNQLLPQGCIGELCIAGAGLARGYINQPELTAQRFISLQLPAITNSENHDPEDNDPEKNHATSDSSTNINAGNNKTLRVYKTGDLARIKENGSLEFIGRNDNQVKIRGFRIELGEIEQQLINLSGVQEAVVISLADKSGSNYLCAYFTATETVSVAHLKKILGQYLPDYMVPAVLLQLDAMPLTRNGKVDRRALPAPHHEITPTLAQTPMTALEVQLSEIWRSLLPVTNITRDDNFFNLGGHSFKAVAMVSLIRQQLEREITVKTVFANPTLGALATALESTVNKTYTTIPAAAPKEYYPASSAQKRLFALSQLNAAQITYNIPAVYNILGPLDYLKLQDALNQLIQRHESLRTSLAFIDGEVMQTIHNRSNDNDDSTNNGISANIEFFSGSAEHIDNCIARFIRPFDLSQAPLVRLGVFSIDEYQHVLMMNVHHAVADGISLSIYLQELAALYEGASLQPLRLQHKDYSEWELSEHYATITRQQREFWLSLLPDNLPLLDLPTDYPRPAKSSHRGQGLRLELAPSLAEKLRTAAQQQGYTLYMVTLAAFGIVLHKYSRQQDLMIGTPAMGRQHPDLQAVTGMLVNTLALRLTPSPDSTLKNYLDQIKQMVIGAVDNQGFLFEELLNHLNPATDSSRSPVFDVFFSLVTEELGQFSLPGTQTTLREFEFPIAKFDLSLTVYERTKGFDITLEYATDLFKPETAQQWLHHYQMVIEQLGNGLLDSAQQKISKQIGELTLVDHNEQHILLNEFNNTTKEYPIGQTLSSVFETQAGKTPDNIAVVFADSQLTYKQLNARANQLARQLRELGVGRDKIVAVLLERSLELPVVLFAILKAGGAYLPVGPNLPQDRIDYMLDDSQAQLVISHSKFSPQLENFNGQQLLIDQWLAQDNLSSIDNSNPAAQSGPDDLAYIIYTSGSTGRPKGAMIEHRAVLNRIFWMQDQYPLTETDVILQKTPYTFDVSVWELFWWSFAGASVYFLTPDAEKDPQAIFGCIDKQNISVMHFVPSMLNASLEYLAAGSQPHKLGSLRNVFASGEALSPAQVENFNRLIHTSSGAQLINLYGPTEAAIDVTWFDCPTSGPIARVPIGKPISNIQLYILDEQQQLVPRGIAGELYISGTGVGRGYINKPELSNEKFSADPFATHLRMYRTGDLCRWLDDGNIEYLGRLDHQVKIRGYRIELGEIESRLLSHPRIRDTVVMARQDVQSENYLCAYVVDRTPTTEPHELMDELHRYLAQWLPDYMVPTVIQVLDAMPLNASGKVDRHALPEPDQQFTNTSANYCAPETALEKQMVQLWETALGRSPIGLNDDFFALGGSSLSLIRLLSLITNTFGVSLPIATFFDTPILRDIAAIVAATGDNSAHRSDEIPAAPEKTWYKTSASQQRMYILDQFEEASRSYLITALFRIQGKLDIAKLESAFHQLIHLHEVLRTRFSVQDNSIMQAIEADVAFALEKVTLPGTSTREEPLEQIINDCLQPLDLACAPLMRASLIEEGTDNYCLVIYWHHIIVDGVSINLLLKDLADLYNGQTPERTGITFKDYAEWEQSGEYATRIEDDKNYWLGEFQGEIPALALAADFKRPSQRSFAGGRIKREIPASLMNAAQQFSEQQGYTLFMTLLAALNILLHKHTQQDEIIIGTPVAGRGLGNCDEICGMFVNTLPLSSPVDRRKTFIQYCEQVKQTVLQGLEHQQYPFDQLVEQLDIPRDTSRNPMFDVMFALQNHGEQQLPLDQLETSSLICPLPIAKFDLTVTLFQLANNILCDFEFCTDLFDPRTIEKLADHYLYTLQQFVATPDLTIDEFHFVAAPLPLAPNNFSPVANNTTNSNSQPTKLAHQLFEEQAALTPHATALMYRDKEITYAELDEQAERICAKLVACGAGPEKFIGVMLGRSPELIASLLGILKAGAAYLPIDPEYPLERKAYQLQDSQCALLISQADSEIPTNWEGTLLSVDKICPDIFSANATAPNPAKSSKHFPSITAENAAYCIYTSGSTGTPKGVVIEHRNLVNLIKAQRDFYGITAQEKVLLFAAPVFDASLEQIFVALTSGASLLVVDDENIRDHLLMQNIIAEQQITHLNAVPAFLNLLEPQTLPALKRVVCGADICSPELARKWSTQCKFINVYGPTETTISSTVHSIDADSFILPSIPIGQSIAQTTTYVVDNKLRLVPNGIPGELCIGGAGVARGYLNNPELTREKFINSPVDNSGRWYRTGDLVRRNVQGELEYLGRIDAQVKIRGFRIEPGEIEAVLASYPGIIQAAIAVKDDVRTGKFLCAYYVAEQEFPAQHLQGFLASHLPHYMVPGWYLRLAQLPLTAGGKINRPLLPVPDRNSATQDNAHPASSAAIENYTALEQYLLTLWKNQLGITTLGIDDNFFQAGGHSITATLICADIQKMYAVKIPLKEFFRLASVRKLANYLSGILDAAVGQQKNHSVPLEISSTIRDHYPLSKQQQGIYVLSLFNPEATHYNIPSAYQIRGPLDASRLEQAINSMLQRHNALRSNFTLIEGEPVCVVRPYKNMALQQKIVTTQEQQKIQVHLDEFVKPFDLENDSLFRCLLLRCADDLHILALDVHHIVADGTSFQLLLAELHAAYTGASLPAVEFQYTDYAVWQTSGAAKQLLASQENYWLEKLTDLPPLDLKADYPRPHVQSFDGDYVDFEWNREESTQILTLARQLKVTPFTLFCSTFALLLQKYTDQKQILLGTVTAGREEHQLQNIWGMFVNTLVLKLDVNSTLSFADYVQGVQTEVLESFAHQQYPFDQLVQKLDAPRDTSRNPIFDVMFTYLVMDAPKNLLGLEEFIPYKTGYSSAKNDLTLNGYELDGKILFNLEYCTRIFSRARIERMAGHFKNLVRQIISQPNHSLQNLAIMDRDEYVQLVHGFNQTLADYPRNKTIAQVFREQVLKTPHDRACYYEGHAQTYAELDNTSEQLAQHLHSHFNIGPGSIVALLCKRSLRIPQIIFAVLKTGAAYLPLDPDYPDERIREILESAATRLLLTDDQSMEGHHLNSFTVLNLDQLDTSSARSSISFPVPDASDPAYIIYTSGSTGKPKGVVINQRGVLNLSQWFNQTHDLHNNRHVLQMTNYCFDVSVEEIIIPLLHGAAIFIPAEQIRLDKAQLLDFIRQHRINIAQLVPGLLHDYLIESPFIDCLKRIITGAERLDPVLKDAVIAKGYSLFNSYGPTETTVSACGTLCIPGRDIIGKPVANTRIYILDCHNHPTPIGVPGELCIAGDLLASGYLNDAAMTTAKFVDNPFEKNEKMYRTGDLCCFLDDGNIEFIGRIDNQVKLRGFRIELGEIESRLISNEHVSNASVLVRNDGNSARLCAYVTASTDIAAELLREQLKAQLRHQLPAYMIPEYFLVLDKMPLNRNGKIDKPKLLALPLHKETGFSANQLLNITEQQLIELWKKVLPVDYIDVDSNFFELGGNSLLIIKLHSLINNKFAQRIPVAKLFQYASIREFAAYLNENQSAAINNRNDTTISTIQEIAIIGMAGRFPAAKNLEQFWENLKTGRECVSFFSAEELLPLGFEQELLDNPDFVAAKAIIDDANAFDPEFFNYHRRDALLMDPQLRVFHEVVYQGLEHSGNNPFTSQEKIGLFAGASSNPEWQQRVKMHCQSPGEQFAADLVSDKDFLTTRIAYSLNLRGPALNVQTACSTSLVAVDLACQSLLTHKCSIAVAGGVSLGYPHKSGYLYQDGMVMSPDGHCRAFDADARGTTAGEGAGVVVLKRLEDAIADGDNIYAVIKGSATNNDGQQKMGFTAPGINGQADVIRSALAAAKIPAETIRYLEAHGTGTVLGDPLEIAALTDAFTESSTQATADCRIGSVKTNIGHLDAAAGIAGLLKTVLALHHQQLPPSINYSTPNPKIEFGQTPFSVQTRLEDWTQEEYPRRAGVSSFGIGGTNAHIILEEFIDGNVKAITPENADSIHAEEDADNIHATEKSWLIPLAAHSEDAFQKNYENLKHWIIQTNPELADVAITLALVRSNFSWRAALVVKSIAELLAALDETIAPVNVAKSTNTTVIADDSAFTAGQLKTHWLAGDDIDWEKIYSTGYQHKLALPAYAFAREIFELPNTRTATLANAIAHPQSNQIEAPLLKQPLDQWFYTTGWQSWYSANKSGMVHHANHPILAFVDDLPFTQELLSILKSEGADVIQVQHGDNSRQLDKNHYQIETHNAQSYRELFKQVLIGQPYQILYFCGTQYNVIDINESPDLALNKANADIEKGLLFAQALAAMEIDYPVNVHLMGSGLFEVTGDEVIDPVALAISGFFSVLAEEIPLLNCKILDTGSHTKNNRHQHHTIAKIIVNNLFNPELPDVLAYRGKQAFARNIQPLALPERINNPSTICIKQQGTYLITGGFGGVGSTLANYLAGQWQANLILVSRTALPERNTWDRFIADNPAENKIVRAIQLIQQLEQKGSRVLYFAADIGDCAAIQEITNNAEHTFGEIHGVIHAAGTADGALAAHRTPAQNDAVLQAKIRGTLVLDAVFNNKPLDFMVYCSSLNSLLPQAGQLAYVAANLFQNAFARAQKAQRFTLAINWDTWLEVGMAAEYQQLMKQRDSKTVHNSLPGITPAEGVQVFERALQIGLPELLISTVSLTDYLQQQKRYKAAQQLSFITNKSGDAEPVVANAEALQEQIATIWKSHFNQNDIDLQTDFFSLGDSIDAIQILEQINKTLDIKLASGALMDFPSIQTLTAHIESLNEKSSRKKETPQLITQLKAANAKARKIFLIHPVGGTTYFYRALADAFTNDIGIYAIHAQGINDDLAPLTSIEAMVTRYLSEIRQLQPHGPYTIGGASFGGVVAFAMACHLKKAGEKVELLFMIDTPNPRTITDLTEEDYEIMAGSLVDNFDDKDQLNEVIKTLQNMSEDQRYEYFGNQLKDRSSTGGIDTDSQYLKTLMAIHQINNTAMLRYTPGVYNGQMLYFRPSQKSLEHLGLEMDLDWQPHVQKPIISHTIHGNHFTMNEGQGAIMIAHHLEKHLFTASEKNIAVEVLE